MPRSQSRLAFWLLIYYTPDRHPRVTAEERDYVLSDPPVAPGAAKVPWQQVLRYPQTWGLLLARFFSDPVWWFYLFYALVGLVLALPGTLVMMLGIPASQDQMPGPAFWIGLMLLVLASLAQLAFIIPMLAVGCRRLHDRGQSGWLQLLMLVPCGSIVLIVFWVLDGTPGDNAYGTPSA